MLAAFVYPRAYTAKRQLLLFVPYLLIAFAWWWPWQARRRRLLSVVAALSLVAALSNIILVPKSQWREAAAYIGAHAQPNDLVLLTPTYMAIPFDRYALQDIARQGLPYGVDEEELSTMQAQHQRIWLVLDPFDTDPNQRLKHWLSDHAQLAQDASFYRLDVQLYTTASP